MEEVPRRTSLAPLARPYSIIPLYGETFVRSYSVWSCCVNISVHASDTNMSTDGPAFFCCFGLALEGFPWYAFSDFFMIALAEQSLDALQSGRKIC